MFLFFIFLGLESPEEAADQYKGLKEVGEDLEELEDVSDSLGAAPVPASAQGNPNILWKRILLRHR